MNAPKQESETYNKLPPEAERVIVNKGTERPFSGEFYEHDLDGLYTCRRCDRPLFSSSSKFKSGCGWPSFDDNLPGAVKAVPDADGSRTEIVCANCGGHLGHVFKGERFTDKNTRHCVNSVSMSFVPQENLGRAIFAGGCFWGVEHHLQQEDGVLEVTSGFIGGTTDNPSYKDVCYKDTGHAEAVEVVYDKTRTDYETLARVFFEIHDPTQVDRQGPDVGDQYRSEIFYLDEDQKEVAEKLIGLLRDKGLKIATRVTQATTFWPAEDYHQDYYARKGAQPYCHARVQRF